MAIVQFYKSQVQIGANLFPVLPNGGSLNWPSNHAIPAFAGNYWQINYVEGFQMPTIDLQLGLVDGASAKCPFNATFMGYFLKRSADYQHDVSAIGSGLKFFDGYSGFVFDYAKANSFSIGGSKGDDIRFNCNLMVYDSTNPTSLPAPTTTPPDNTYPYFAGTPIRFQACRFIKNGSPLSGVVSWDITFSNNMTPDMSMATRADTTWPHQSPFPVDANAGMLTCGARFVFQADSSAGQLANGDTVSVQIKQSSIDMTFILKSLVVDTPKERSVGSGRQLRSYSCVVVGTGNSEQADVSHLNPLWTSPTPS